MLAVRFAGEVEAELAIRGELVPVHRYLTSPSGTTETVALFCGRVDSRNAGGIHGVAAEHEGIKVVVKGPSRGDASFHASREPQCWLVLI